MNVSRSNTTFLIIAAVGIFCGACVGAESCADGPEQLLLASDGQARVPLVVTPQASETIREVAAELADCLSRMTGASFEVTAEDGAGGIMLGTLAEFPSEELAEPLRIYNTYDGREAYAIRTENNRLLLLGATDLGASHAAFRLLEHLGCRWFFPAKEWEIIPSRPTLAVSLNETDRPALLGRRIWWGYGFFDQDRCSADYRAWARHNRMASSMTISCGHAWQAIIARNRDVFDSHPEYLALVDGERRGPQLCVSNARVRDLVRDYALDELQRQPDRDMVSLETSDGSNHCECDGCVELGGISERVFGLANEVARAVTEEFPGRMVGLYAYNDHCEPPPFALEPNVYVQSTAGFIRGRYTFDELIELWPNRCRNLGFYEYLSVWLWDWDMPPGGRGSDLEYLRRQIPRYIEHGATSIDCESGNNWGIHGLGYYIANKLMWDPTVDVEALLDDFLERAFGPAEKPMRRYYRRFEPRDELLISEHLLATMLRDLQEASELARDRPNVLARLDHLKQYQHYVRLRWDFDRTGEEDRKRELALAILTHAYRTRHSYMNHWAAIRQQWTPAMAEKFNEPAWSYRDRSAKPWKVETACTREETERLFQEDIARFQPQPVREKRFSENLVPSGLETENPAGSSQRYQGKARYAMFSRAGEPLEVTITTGVIAWYRDRPAASYVISDAASKAIAEGRLPQDGEEHSLRVDVPRAGLYWLDFDDQAAAWQIAAEAGRPVALALCRGPRLAHLGHMQPMYFFVPKGTTRIDYFWDGGPHEVHASSGKLVAKVAERGRFVSIDVPPGEDGRAWWFGKLALGRLWFFNVPNYLAASPDSLLVPREAATSYFGGSLSGTD